MNMFFGGFTLLLILLYIALLGLGIFCTVLFIKLAFRGIKALDIYISQNSGRQDPLE